MIKIWYALKCPKKSEQDYTEIYEKLTDSGRLKEVISFEYQRMMRYGGGWHMERKKLLPGWIFLSGVRPEELKRSKYRKNIISLIPCETPYMKTMCQEGNLIGMSKGIIREGKTVITSGPLKGREYLIRRIDRHKRTAEIEVPFAGENTRVTVGLEIYEKQM